MAGRARGGAVGRCSRAVVGCSRRANNQVRRGGVIADAFVAFWAVHITKSCSVLEVLVFHCHQRAGE